MRLIILSLTFLLFISGCVSNQDWACQVSRIEQKHGVKLTIRTSCHRWGMDKMLDCIDRDLERCPPYFKDNIGPIFIEKSFDEIGLRGLLLASYVDAADIWNRHPIHLRNRHFIEKILFPVPREDQIFLHEASHSFELNIKAEISNEWEKFYEDFEKAQVKKYSKAALLWRGVLTFGPRPSSMPSLYGSADHYEDFAETHCYLRRNNIELVKYKDPVLYSKCKIVDKFINGWYRAVGNSTVFPLVSSQAIKK